MPISEHDSGPVQTILLVEDEAIVAMAEKAVLERHGYEVIIAYTGEEAVDVASDNREESLVLMDIDLGSGIDGPVAAEMILANRDVPVVFLSSHTEPEVVAKTEGITSYGYIVKNSGETVLVASIKMAFRLHEATRRANESANMLSMILDVSGNLVATLDLQTILQSSSDQLSELAGMNAGAIYLVDGDRITLRATTPPLPPDFPNVFRRACLVDHPHIERSIKQRAPIFVPNTAEEDFTKHEKDVCDRRGLHSILYVPLVSRDNAVGIYMAGATERPTLVPQTVVDLCVILSNMAALAVENATIFGKCYDETTLKRCSTTIARSEAIETGTESNDLLFTDRFDCSEDV